MTTKNSRVFTWIHSVFVSLFALVVWFVSTLVSFAIITILDRVRGTEHAWGQSIFRELVAPAIGGYVAIFASQKVFIKARLNIVFWGLSIPVFLFMIGVPIYVIIFEGDNFTYSTKEQILRWCGGVLTIAAAYFAAKRHSKMSKE